jgi:hypothetical protein
MQQPTHAEAVSVRCTPRTTTISVRPSILLPPHTITEPCLARCCCVKRDTRTGRLGCKDTSLNLFLTAWSDTVTPVTLLWSCCNSPGVAERRRNARIVRYRSSTILSTPPCELACLIVAIPQAVNNRRRDIEIHSNTTKIPSFLDQSDGLCDLNPVKMSHGMYWFTYNMLNWPQ